MTTFAISVSRPPVRPFRSLGSEGAQLDIDHLAAGPEIRETYLQRISDIAEGTWVIPTGDPPPE